MDVSGTYFNNHFTIYVNQISVLCTLNLYRMYVDYFSMKLEKVRYELVLLGWKTLGSINKAN